MSANTIAWLLILTGCGITLAAAVAMCYGCKGGIDRD